MLEVYYDTKIKDMLKKLSKTCGPVGLWSTKMFIVYNQYNSQNL